MLEWSKYDWKTNFIAFVVSKILLSEEKNIFLMSFR